jgi:hypothetical protein
MQAACIPLTAKQRHSEGTQPVQTMVNGISWQAVQTCILANAFGNVPMSQLAPLQST